MQKRLIYCALGVMLTSACVHQPGAVELAGLEQYRQNCPSEPPILSDADLQAVAGEISAAANAATPRDREDAFREKVLFPLLVRDQQHRACSGFERTRAEGLLVLGARFNEALGRHD